MSIHTTQLLKTSNTYPYFTLYITPGITRTHIRMQLSLPFNHTDTLDDLESIMKTQLPSILHSRCYNDADLPFSIEMKHTEIGHLFEHILLEYLCEEKLASGFTNAIYNGCTYWNWAKEKSGTFHISLDAGYADNPLFSKALPKSITLLNQIIQAYPSAKTLTAPL